MKTSQINLDREKLLEYLRLMYGNKIVESKLLMEKGDLHYDQLSDLDVERHLLATIISEIGKGKFNVDVRSH